MTERGRLTPAEARREIDRILRDRPIPEPSAFVVAVRKKSRKKKSKGR